MNDKYYECMEAGHHYDEVVECPGCGAYLGAFCTYCGAEVSGGYNVDTCRCDNPEWAEEALESEDTNS